MLDSQPKQMSLDGTGQIFWQKDASNPLPGVAVARLVRGDALLRPKVEITGNLPEGVTAEAAQGFLATWLAAHIVGVLEPLIALADVDGQPAPVQQICARLFNGLGILPREELEDQITLLDPEMRKTLRAKKVKLGPVLVFLPDLNKPAAVRMRALLWGLYNDKTLPMNVPADGIVSVKAEEGAGPLFYRTIGYPLYGPRAVRIDMLDRVIVAVYDSASGGKFQAKHEMAEWLGSPIEDLYAVLEAMGHKKIEEQPVAATAPAMEEKPAEEATKEKVKEKPPLAWFRLKKGKASQAEQPRREKHKRKEKPPVKKQHPKKDKKERRADRGPRVISAAAKVNPEDNPFAVLQQLKVKNDGQA